MSTNAITARLQTLNQTVPGLELEGALLCATCKGRTLTVQEVEASHERIFTAIQRTLSETAELSHSIADQTTFSNQEQMFGTAIEATDLEDRVKSALTRVNDILLTHFPTARINYGTPVIGPKMNGETSIVREIRGDGNCFISSLTTRFLESLVEERVVDRFINFVTMSNIEVPNLKEEVLTTLLRLQSYPSELERVLQDNHSMLPFISFFRHLGADEMLVNRDLYEPAFRSDIQDIFNGDGQQNYEDLIDQYVLKMGVDCSQPIITALCTMLNFQVNIIDRKIGAPQGKNILDEGAPKATFCRQGAHYFVLYNQHPNIVSVSPVQQPIAIQEIPTPCIAMTQIPVKFDAGYGNNLVVRGSAPGMSWERGMPLRNTGADSWVFEIPSNARNCEFKLVLNDTKWEEGLNRRVNDQGQIVNGQGQIENPVVPRFPK